MKKIGFIGAYDKIDLIMYISKILVENNSKVLIIDGTTLQKTRYIIPSINPTHCYVTTYEGIDFAIGFDTLDGILYYTQNTDLDYDYIFFDIDNRKAIENFELQTLDKNYFVTAFDNYSLKKGLEILGKSEEKVLMTKVLFSVQMDKEEEEHLNFMSFYYAVEWCKEKIYFPYDVGDSSVTVENQKNSRISFKELSQEYKTGLLEMIQEIKPEIRISDVKKMLKNK